MIWACVKFGESLPERGAIPWLDNLIIQRWEDLNRAETVIDKAVADPCISWEKGMFGHFFVICSVIFICAQTWLQSGSIFVLLQQSQIALFDVGVLWNCFY